MPRDSRHWSAYEAEVSLYYANEEGVSAQGYEPSTSPSAEPKPPRFAPGVDPYTMFTVIDRLLEADKDMPCLKRKVTMVDGKVASWGDDREEPDVCSPSLPPTQQLTGEYRPSASMVLRAAYGVLSCKYRDSAPNGDRLLKQAQAAYVSAALRVPRRTPRVSVREKLNARFDRAFAGDDE